VSGEVSDLLYFGVVASIVLEALVAGWKSILGLAYGPLVMLLTPWGL